MQYPKEFGKVAKDLSPNIPSDNNTKTLYVITTDTENRNFMALPRPYGVFWSAQGPEPVNQIAIELWSTFGSSQGRDEEYNLDGSETKQGECYDGFACFNYGEVALTLRVEKVEVDDSRTFLNLYKKGLIQKALALRDDIKIDDAFKNAIEILRTTMSHQREEGVLDPLYDIFGYSKRKVEADG